MDGYAVRAEDGAGVFAVVDTIAAAPSSDEQRERVLERGQVARITTGAPLPDGADAVQMIERTRSVAGGGETVSDERRVEILEAVSPGQFVRPIGSDIAVGDVVARCGDVVDANVVGLLATLGVGEVSVRARPVVAVASTGDELVDATSSPLAHGQIRDSNRAMLLSHLRSPALARHVERVIDAGIVRDVADSLEDRVRELFEKNPDLDVLVTSGGVSMGHADLLKPLLERLGAVHFGRVALKPGKPTTFATIVLGGRKRLVFSLPGNPVSASVTFSLFVEPALRRCAVGAREGAGRHRRVRASIGDRDGVRGDRTRTEFHRVTLEWRDDKVSGHYVAHSTGARQQSSRLASMYGANALLVLPPRADGSPFVHGDVVDAFLLSSS